VIDLSESYIPQKLSHEIITAAIAGFEAQKKRIDSEIAELRNMLDHRHAAAEAPKPKRKISAASRRRMALPKDLYQARSHRGFFFNPRKYAKTRTSPSFSAMGMKKRWAAVKGRSAARSA
jgi:hypothetical protein